jgi:tRNA threonylcarbamoyladenosine biosynthesis protein TsaE
MVAFANCENYLCINDSISGMARKNYICYMEIIFNLSEIDKAAADFLQLLKDKKVVAFNGQMGAGKTTFINAVCRVLGVHDAMGSPTFSIINEYNYGHNNIIYHLDLYRLRDEEEARQAGVEDCLFSGNYCFAEWPDKAPHLFPEDTVHCFLNLAGNETRKLQIKL